MKFSPAIAAATARLAALACGAGLPADALRRFFAGGYAPQPLQVRFHAAARACDAPNGPTQIGIGGARGPGKALGLDTLIPTPDGWTTMGALRAGDTVFAPDGSPTRVLGCSEVQEGRDCYEVLFSDGARIVADGEHLWQTFTKSERVALKKRTDEYRARRRAKRNKSGLVRPWCGHSTKAAPTGGVRTTRDILLSLKIARGEINHCVKVASPLDLPEKALPFDPYLLGVWLGDGDSARGWITTADAEIVEAFKADGWELRERGPLHYSVANLTARLSRMYLLNAKRVPEDYLRASTPQRLALLQGLMDSDGCADRDGRCEFTSTKYKLAKGCYDLALTLGIKATICEGVATLYGRNISPKWRVCFSSCLPCFRLERKLKRQKRAGFNGCTEFRYIVAVNPVSSVPVRCIRVEHPLHCFLAGAQMIPTHNSHAVFAQIALDDCQRADNIKVLYLRRVAKNAREQFEDLRLSVLRGTPHEYNRSTGVMTFPNKSRIILGHFKAESDVDKYLGLEYDVIAIEEATTLTLTKYRALRDSNRTSKANFRPRIYSSTNPGGVGHAWYKATFIKPARDGTEKDTRFIFGTIEDNVFVDPGYRAKLEENTGWKLKAYRYGDWDIAAGQFFSTWRREAHVRPRAELDAIPAHWPVWCAMDYGFQHPTVVLLFTEFDGVIRVVDECAASKRLPVDLAEDIKAMLGRHGVTIPRLRSFVAGSDVFSQRGDSSGKTIANQYENAGIKLTAADMDRINGWGEVLRLLGDTGNGRPAKMLISERCATVIEQIPVMQHDPKRPDDVLKVNVDEDGNGGDDAADCLRYGVMIKRPARTTMGTVQFGS